MSGSVNEEREYVVFIWLALCSLYTALLTATVICVVLILRKRRSRLWSRQRSSHALLSGLHCSAGAPAPAAAPVPASDYTRRVDFFQNTSVADFAPHGETYRQYYYEKLKKRESTGNGSVCTPLSVGRVGKRIFELQFQEDIAVDKLHSRTAGTINSNRAPEQEALDTAVPTNTFQVNLVKKNRMNLLGNDLLETSPMNMSDKFENEFSTVKQLKEGVLDSNWKDIQPIKPTDFNENDFASESPAGQVPKCSSIINCTPTVAKESKETSKQSSITNFNTPAAPGSESMNNIDLKSHLKSLNSDENNDKNNENLRSALAFKVSESSTSQGLLNRIATVNKTYSTQDLSTRRVISINNICVDASLKNVEVQERSLAATIKPIKSLTEVSEIKNLAFTESTCISTNTYESASLPEISKHEPLNNVVFTNGILDICETQVLTIQSVSNKNMECDKKTNYSKTEITANTIETDENVVKSVVETNIAEDKQAVSTKTETQENSPTIKNKLSVTIRENILRKSAALQDRPNEPVQDKIFLFEVEANTNKAWPASVRPSNGASVSMTQILPGFLLLGQHSQKKLSTEYDYGHEHKETGLDGILNDTKTRAIDKTYDCLPSKRKSSVFNLKASSIVLTETIPEDNENLLDEMYHEELSKTDEVDIKKANIIKLTSNMNEIEIYSEVIDMSMTCNMPNKIQTNCRISQHRSAHNSFTRPLSGNVLLAYRASVGPIRSSSSVKELHNHRIDSIIDIAGNSGTVNLDDDLLSSLDAHNSTSTIERKLVSSRGQSRTNLWPFVASKSCSKVSSLTRTLPKRINSFEEVDVVKDSTEITNTDDVPRSVYYDAINQDLDEKGTTAEMHTDMPVIAKLSVTSISTCTSNITLISNEVKKSISQASQSVSDFIISQNLQNDNITNKIQALVYTADAPTEFNASHSDLLLSEVLNDDGNGLSAQASDSKSSHSNGTKDSDSVISTDTIIKIENAGKHSQPSVISQDVTQLMSCHSIRVQDTDNFIPRDSIIMRNKVDNVQSSETVVTHETDSQISFRSAASKNSAPSLIKAQVIGDILMKNVDLIDGVPQKEQNDPATSILPDLLDMSSESIHKAENIEEEEVEKKSSVTSNVLYLVRDDDTREVNIPNVVKKGSEESRARRIVWEDLQKNLDTTTPLTLEYKEEEKGETLADLTNQLVEFKTQIEEPPSPEEIVYEPSKQIELKEKVDLEDEFFEAINTDIKLPTLRKTNFDDEIYARDTKTKVIPNYLEDVSSGLKELMQDLVKPNSDIIPFSTTIRSQPSKVSLPLQTNLITSSQIDVTSLSELVCDSGSKVDLREQMLQADFSDMGNAAIAHALEQALERQKVEDKSIQAKEESLDDQQVLKHKEICFRPRRQPDYPIPEQVLVFDHENPLNNIILAPVNIVAEDESRISYPNNESSSSALNVEVLKLRPRESQPKSLDSKDMFESHSIYSTDSRPVAIDHATSSCIINQCAQVNTIISMKRNKELLAADSSLTLIDDCTSRSSRNSSISKSPVRVIFKVHANEKDSDFASNDDDSTPSRNRNLSPKRHSPRGPPKHVNITPKPSIKLHKMSSSPMITKKMGKTSSKLEKSDSSYESVTDEDERHQSKFKKWCKKKLSKKFGADVTVQRLLTEYYIGQNKRENMSKEAMEVLSKSSARSDMDRALSFAGSFMSSTNPLGSVGSRTTNGSTVDWQDDQSMSIDYDPSVNVVAKIDMLSFMGSPVCEWEPTVSSDTWSFLLLYSRLRLAVRLSHRHDNAPRTRVRADTPVKSVAIHILHEDKPNSLAELCTRCALQAMQEICARADMRVAARAPALLRRCAVVARLAARWGRAMHAAHAHLAYTLADKVLTLKVANIPLRSVWEVTMRIDMCPGAAEAEGAQGAGRGPPWPRAGEVRAHRVVADADVTPEELERVLANVPKDWGHVPRTLWKVFRYLKYKTAEDANLFGTPS